METSYRGVRIFLEQGDITLQRTDAIVNPANSLLVMGGGVAGTILRVGGRSIQDEALRKAPVKIGAAVETNAGQLRQRYVIHAPTMARPAQRTDTAAIRSATLAALEKASSLGLRSVALPGMGTGVGGVTADNAAASMVEALASHVDRGTSLKEIRLVAFQSDLLEAFRSALLTINQI